MLVLSRKLNEEILIDGGIRVKILEISGNRIKLGIDAPAQTNIVREEVIRQSQHQHQATASSQEYHPVGGSTLLRANNASWYGL